MAKVKPNADLWGLDLIDRFAFCFVAIKPFLAEI